MKRTELRTKSVLVSHGGLKPGAGLQSRSVLTSKLSLQSRGGINTVSSKQKDILSELSDVYTKMSKSVEQKCTGCGSRYNLTHSHIIPRSYRPDLVTVADNITYHCTRCHSIWEWGSIDEKKELLDFKKSMSYIEGVDKKYHKLITSK